MRSADENRTRWEEGRVCMCGHEVGKGPGTFREKNIRDHSQASHGTSTHTSFSKSLTNTPLNLSQKTSGPPTHYNTQTHTHSLV